MKPYPLSTARSGCQIIITAVSNRRVHKRLFSMGLPPGTQLTVIRNHKGTVVIGRQHDRMAIGRTLAERILVQETS